MNKAVLIMDMPEGCRRCRLYHYPSSFCCATDKRQNNISDGYKPSWCPLRPLPEKKPMPQEDKTYKYDNIKAEGWNDCLDEITGGSDDE